MPFLSDLSEGIFGRLKELRQEQQTKDDEQKKQTLGLLSSLADKVEPESLPLLLGHMGDVIGMKGDLRKFWDAFSGMPDRSLADNLGTKLRDVSSQFVGPEKARTARQSNLQQLLEPYRQTGQRPRRVADLPPPAELEQGIVFRDPVKERLSEIESRYTAQSEAALEKQNLLNVFRLQQQEDAQRHSKEMAELKANFKAEEDINELAKRMATERGFATVPPAIKMEAARQLAKREGWSDELLKSRISYLGAKTDEARTMADTMKRTGGLTPGQEVNVEDRRREAARSLKSAYDKAMASRAEAKKLVDDLANEITQKLEKAKKGATFDPATGSVVPSKTDPHGQFADYPVRDQLQAYRKAAAALAGAETEAKGHWGNLSAFPYNRYYSPGKDFTEPVTETLDSIATPAPSSAGTTLPLTRGTIRIPPREGVVFNVGQLLNYAGKKYVVTGIQEDGTATASPWKR